MEIVNSILGSVAQCLLDSIKVRCGYLKHYDDNIIKLGDLVGTLEAREADVLKDIQAAERNDEEIRETVQRWIASVNGVKMEAKKFLEDNGKANKRCFEGWFPNVRTLYKLSREAERKREAIKGLFEEEAGFGINVSLPAPPPETDSITSKDFVPFQTTKLAMEKVMDALKEDSTNFVGIYGMGGVGKTTLAKEIARKSKEERLFDKVAMAVVSQAVNIESIQEQIANFFLPFKLEGKSTIVRANQLNDRIRRENKILVILDDVWAEPDLATIGIPSVEDHKGCKVVITTRREQVCTSMGRNVQSRRIVFLGVLSKEESWDLFKLHAGDIIESPTVRIAADKLVKECEGLPVALVTVGKAMRGKHPEEWKQAALELEKSNPANIEDMDEKVFKCIKFSYDYLRDEEAKACFLLCCLFPEDYNIETETLVRYGVGLSTFKGINKIQEARSRAHLIITNLKASSLLLAGEEEGYIKMHDVVRDVAKRIALGRYIVKAGEGLKEWPNELTMDGYNGIGGISLMRCGIQKYPDALECPDLEILLMQDNKVEQEMPEEVFKGIKKLRVLDQSQNYINGRLEPSFSHLTNLRTLIIDSGRWSSRSIRGISALGELKMLQVVSLRWWRFEEPLDALRQMKNLRLLDLTGSKNCSSLFNFGEDFNFPKLEELYLTEGMSCGVAELMKCCPRLNVLKFVFKDIIQIPDNFDFSHLDHFDIAVGARLIGGAYLENSLCFNNAYERPDDVALPNRVRTLLTRVSRMTLSEWNGLRKPNINPYLVVSKDSLAVLKILQVQYSNKLEYLFDLKEEVKDVVEEEKGILANLTDLHLSFLSNLEELWKGHIELVHLRNLKTVDVYSCPKLKVVFHWSVAQRLEQLQKLSVRHCDELEEIIERETGEEAVHKGSTNLVPFRNLKRVDIVGCNKLKVIFHWSVAQRLEQLQELSVGVCGELEEIIGRETGEEAIHKGSTNLVPFRNLKTVKISLCPKLKVVFHWSVAQRLEQLQQLSVEDCDELEEIVGRETREEVVHKGSTNLVPFRNLQEVEINRCPKLKVVFHWSVAQRLEQLQELSVGVCGELEEIIERETGEEAIHKGSTNLVPFRNLKTVKISLCPKLKVVFHWSVAQRLEQLQELSVEYCKELEEIVGRETGEAAVHKVLFPQLQDLHFWRLPKLNGFYTGNLPGSQSTPKLKTVRMGVDWDRMDEIPLEGRDLDRVIKENKGLLVPL